MDELSQLKNKMETDRPVSWNEFPDISLYKDQVLSYMQRQLIRFSDDGQITSAMINNYIKDKLLPRAEGKRYTREHLAGLTEIGLLKQVISVSDTGLLLREELTGSTPEAFYTKFRQVLDGSLSDTAEKIDPSWDIDALSDMALKLAITSYCHKLACQQLLELIRINRPSEVQKKSK